MADNIIIVIGDITSRQYQPLRTPYLDRGERVRVVRISSKDCEWQGLDWSGTFCDSHNIDPDQIVEAIITEADYNHLTGPFGSFVFEHQSAYYWGRLHHLSVVRNGPGGVWIDEA